MNGTENAGRTPPDRQVSGELEPPSPARGSANPSVTFSTLGCKLNLYETDALATRFADGGYDIVEAGSAADVHVINTCTVTNRADRKSRNMLNRARRQSTASISPASQSCPPGSESGGTEVAVGRQSDSLVVLTGCFVDSHRSELESDPNTFVVPNEQKHAIFDLVEARRNGEVLDPAGSVFDFPVPSRHFHTRTMIKVQDGCDNYCSFCIIPFVRGRALSRPHDDVIGAAREAVEGGARELVLTGVNMSRYRDGGTEFSRLVEQLLNVEGEFRLRISSLEPDRLDDRFIDLFHHPKMTPHLHLCLQSASERILLAMRRQYTFGQYRLIAERLRRAHPAFNLTTDIIVGFPGETDDEFSQSLRAIENLGFGHVHTFPYSEREGTRATRMPGRLPERIRTERAAAVRELADRLKTRYRMGLVGTRQRLLVERTESHGDQLTLRGFGESYVPIRAVLENQAPGISEASWENRFLSVEITGTEVGSSTEKVPGLIATLQPARSHGDK